MPAFIGSSPRGIWIGIGVIALMLAGWWLFIRQNAPDADPAPVEAAPGPPPPDPRLTFDTPFRNVKPHVAYVGSQVCAGCHSDIAKTYHQHPMGRSAELTNRAVAIERYDAAARSTFAVGAFDFRVEKQADRVLHHVAVRDKGDVKRGEYSIESKLAIGSGTRGRSYLCIRDGTIWQAPISWFSKKGIWDISPGFTPDVQRPIAGECLYCHTDRVEPIPNTMNRFREPIFRTQGGIGCERCHGPGELHVAERSALIAVDGIDTSIVNPRHLEPELREAICQQCHLQGERRVLRRGRDLFEFRPGLPLEAFVAVYLRHPNLTDYGKSVGQFEQLTRSKCFTSSAGKLGCISCHDPHESPAPAEKVEFYRGKCIACHQQPATECKLPLSERRAKADNCVGCHMAGAPSTSIAHTAVTDHRVLRDPRAEPAHQARPIPAGELPLTAFFTGKYAPIQAESDRDMGIALAMMVSRIPATDRDVRETVLTLAETRLRAALEHWPDDIPALEALADVLATRERAAEALKLFRRVLALAPDRERALARAVEPAVQTHDYEFAAVCASKAIEISPSSIDHRLLRARVRMTQKQWTEAEADCRAALRENPTHAVARVMLAICLRRRGDARNADLELQTALSTVRDPAQELSLRNWYYSRTQ